MISRWILRRRNVSDKLLVNKTNRRTEFQFYWYYYATCFGQPFSFGTFCAFVMNRMLSGVRWNGCTAKQYLWWAERLPETCRLVKGKSKGLPQQAEVAQGVPGRLRPRIFLTFGSTRVVGRQALRIGRLYPRRNPWYSFSEAESTPGNMVL